MALALALTLALALAMALVMAMAMALAMTLALALALALAMALTLAMAMAMAMALAMALAMAMAMVLAEMYRVIDISENRLRTGYTDIKYRIHPDRRLIDIKVWVTWHDKSYSKVKIESLIYCEKTAR